RAVKRFILRQCGHTESLREEGRRLAEDPMYDHPNWGDCNVVYSQLVSDDTFFGQTFSQVVQEGCPKAYRELGTALGKKADELNLDVLERQVRYEASRVRLTKIGKPEAAGQEETPKPLRPRWDAERGVLWYGEQRAKTFKQPADNQRVLLDTFEEEGWPPHIDDPLTGDNKIDRRQRLADACHRLNHNEAGLRFALDGKGEGVLWTPPGERP